MAKLTLHQMIALTAGRKTQTQKLVTSTHHSWGQDAAVSGLSKTYTAKDEDGERLPPESKMPPVNVVDKLKAAKQGLERLYRVVGGQERANRQAQADVTVGDGDFGLPAVPVTLLLFLEKQLTDLRTLVDKLPVLPTDREWDFDENRNCYVTKPVETLRSKKEVEVLVKYPATTEHPAQTDLISKDVIVGTWATTYMSTAIPAAEKAAAMERLERLQEAVKVAREAANSCEAEDDNELETVLDYVFGPLIRRAQS